MSTSKPLITDSIIEAARWLQQGQLLAYPTESSSANNCLASKTITTTSNPIASNGQSSQSNLKPSSNAILIPEHLMPVYEQLDWHGQDLDGLLNTIEMTPAQLIAHLMELELLGVISVQGGRYLRV